MFTPSFPRPRNKYILAFATLLLAFCFNSFYKYLGAGRDDVFITLWAGKTLGTAPWFTNYNGALQEMSSSILATLIAKLSYLAFPKNYYIANKFLQWASALLCLLAIWIYRRLLFRFSPNVVATVSVALLAFDPAFNYWSLSGLETPTYSFLLLLYSITAIQIFGSDTDTSHTTPDTRYYKLLLSLLLTILCRPEGFWLIGTTLVLLAFFWRERREICLKVITRSLLPATVFLLCIFAARYHFTGVIFPNPVYAKVNPFNLRDLASGFDYLFSYYSIGPLNFLFALSVGLSVAVIISHSIRLLRKNPHKRFYDSRWIVISLCIVGYECFVIRVGGDWMEYHRFLTPTVPLKILMLGMLADTFYSRLHGTTRHLVTSTVLIIACLSIYFELNYVSPRDCSTRVTPAILKRLYADPNSTAIDLNCASHRDNLSVLPFIKDDLKTYVDKLGHVTILTYQGGYFPYHVRHYFNQHQVIFIDSAGLLNLDIALANTKKSKQETNCSITSLRYCMAKPMPYPPLFWGINPTCCMN